ncbi:pirin family protein [Inquilinus sp. YAF38]|uniref:pirin family protein n=1 Tax=Inquilinus sp. YAF38 TaxID=3233084 RepID=UPI003F8D9CCC
MATTETSNATGGLTRPRNVTRTLRGRAASEGAGVKLTRVIGQPGLPDLDPFLMLDEFRSDDAADYLAGFPDHPHRGFETVTYMLAGRMRHGDNKGNVGLLGPGSVQWMTAGSGIVHSEMPEQENGLMWGFQLWVNLPAAEKMTAPRYQDIPADSVPEVAAGPGAKVRVIAGRFGGTAGAVEGGTTEPVYLDVHLEAGATVDLPLPQGHAGFAYVYHGAAEVGGEGLERGTLGVLGAGDGVRVAAKAGPARLLIVAGKPLREPVAKYGPFVMTTEAQIAEAIEDFRAGRF